MRMLAALVVVIPVLSDHVLLIILSWCQAILILGGRYTLPETNKAYDILPSPKENMTSPNHPFSGVKLGS